MLLLFNKATTATTAAVNLGTHLSGPWQLYQFSGSSDIALVASGTLDGTGISLANLPPRSASLLILPDSDRIFADSFDQP